ncbi:IGHM protein, partial [Piaya cayana]|nr:IGHM protein [Piaya cayana]
ATSHLRLPLAEGKSRQPFLCEVRHPQGGDAVEVSNPGSTPPIISTSVVTLHPPSQEDFEGPYRNSSLLCQVRASRPPRQLQWLKDGQVLEAGVATEKLLEASGRASVVNSRLSVTQAEWDSGAVFSCLVDGEVRNSSKGLECS